MGNKKGKQRFLKDINNILSKANKSYKEIGAKFSTPSFAGAARYQLMT